MNKHITFTEEEYEALHFYFNNTPLHISAIIKKKGLKYSKALLAAVDKIIKDSKVSVS